MLGNKRKIRLSALSSIVCLQAALRAKPCGRGRFASCVRKTGLKTGRVSCACLPAQQANLLAQNG